MDKLKEIDRIENVANIKYVTVPEAAFILNVDQTTVRRYINIGALEAIELPRNPVSLAEANGDAAPRKAKRGYRILKAAIANMVKSPIDEINAKLIEYYKKYPNKREKKMRERKFD